MKARKVMTKKLGCTEENVKHDFWEAFWLLGLRGC